MSVKTIGFVGYEQVTALDVIGPLEAFQCANAALDDDKPAYRTIILSANGKPFTSETGVTIAADRSFESAPPFDTIIVPGGAGLRVANIADPVAAFLRSRNARTRRMVSVCTGIYAFGVAGLLHGKNATTHWRFAGDVKRRFPDVRLDADALFLRDGSYYSSGGITAGIDLTLSLIESDLGERVALSVARELIVYLKRPGGQLQFSEPLQFQTRALDRFADLAHWIVRNLKSDITVEALANRAGVGARHFSRRFKATFGVTPAAYVEQLRLDEARRRLLAKTCTVDSAAASVGYASSDAFRRAFERKFGIAPSLFRKRFSVR